MRMKLRILLGCFALAMGLRAADTPARALLVLEKAQNSLVIVDPEEMAIVARVPAGNDPHEVAVSDDGKIAYVSNYGGGATGYNTISVIDLVAQKPLPPIDLGELRGPHGLAFSGGKLYFSAESTNVAARYDPATHKIDWTKPTGQDRTHMVLVSKDRKTVFTSNVRSSSISIITQAAGRGSAEWTVTNVPVGHGSEGFDLTPDGKELWVANAQDGTISIIDVAARKVIDTIPSTKAANRLKITPNGKYVFVSDMSGPNLLVINAATHKEFTRIVLPASSEGLLVQPDSRRAYATLNTNDSVAVIDLSTMTMIDEIKTGKGPDGLAWAARR